MIFRTLLAPRSLLAAALLSSLCCFGQSNSNVLTVAPPEKIVAKVGAPIEVKLSLELRSGYHCNSNKPADDYLIPLKLTWAAGALESPEVAYPPPQTEKYSFSPTPLSVYTGNFELVTKFKVSVSAMPGQVMATGKLRYQACTDRMCLPPKNIDISVPVDLIK
jgi:hypothetical protein